MTADFLMLWRWEYLKTSLEASGGRLTNAGSEQFGRVCPGDRLWLVTIPKDSYLRSTGRLLLLGPLRVDRVVSRAEAVKLLGRANIWNASLHAIADMDAAERACQLDITSLAPDLRFAGARDRLTLDDGRVSALQLQTLRRLTPASAALMTERWVQAQETAASSVVPSHIASVSTHTKHG